ncbi:MAG: tRNA1(Val) (adenine(37)-N6)-methyltransferase [Bdellovibrionales bacterium]
MPTETTIDGLLNRRVTLEQPAKGYRVAVDTVLLAAAVPADNGQKILDLGCGAGGAMLCLACRVPGITVTGVEIQDDLAALCQSNITRNAFDACLTVCRADAAICQNPHAGSFDHVMINPPYHDETTHDVSSQTQKRLANSGKPGDLGRWLASAASALKKQGMLTLVHRADRLDEMIGLLRSDFGEIEVLPVAPKAGATAKRVILRARKNGTPVLTFCREFVLHQDDGRFTETTEDVLRHMKVLPFVKAE